MGAQSEAIGLSCLNYYVLHLYCVCVVHLLGGRSCCCGMEVGEAGEEEVEGKIEGLVEVLSAGVVESVEIEVG
jgi:hypothetical protein